jgi:hypothetical protein
MTILFLMSPSATSTDTLLLVLSSCVALFNLSLPYFHRLTPGKNLEVLKHLAMDFSLTPLRLMLIYLSLPVLKGAFIRDTPWTADAVAASNASWTLLSLGYLFDLTHTRPNLMGIAHHSIAFVSTGFTLLHMNTADGTAFWHRYQAAELFFAVGLGGLLGTALRVVYLFASLHGNTDVPRPHRLAVTTLTWALATVISTGWAFKILWVHRTAPLFWAMAGPVGSAGLLCALAVIFVVQYKWIFMWSAKADRLGQKAGLVVNVNGVLRRVPLKAVVGALGVGIVDFGRLYVNLLRTV